MLSRTVCHRSFQRLLLVVFVVNLSSLGLADQMIVDTMDAPTYNSFAFNNSPSNPNDDSSASFLTSAVGGNPGGNLLVQHNHSLFDFDDDSARDASLQSLFIEQSNTYNPNASGTIASLDFSLDVQLETTGLESDISGLFFIVDDALGGNAAGFTNFTPHSNWQTLTVTGLTQADFFARDFAGILDLRFGFGFLSSGNITNPDSVVLRVDNFRINVVTVPEPSAALLVALATTLVFTKRRQRSTLRGASTQQSL